MASAATLGHIAKDMAHHLIRISGDAAERNVFDASNAAPPKYPLTNSTGAPP